MSTSPEDVAADCQAESSRSSLSGSSNGPRQSAAKEPGDKAPAPIEKTISCVSCRKRKLKCDRVKPKCSTCTRLRHDCEYPERRRNLGSKRRNMKELEARLAQVETQLVAETAKASSISAANTTEPDWNNFAMDMNMDMGDTGMLGQDFNMPLSAFDFPSAAPSMPEGDLFSQEIISLGLSEPLPPQEMIDELHDVYFTIYHPTLPMMHKYRYLASLSLPTHMRPPVCLRYAMWATAASISDKYGQYEDVLYERARKYIQEAEMKGHGEAFVTIQFAQAWGLIAFYEAKKTYFTRAWMSTGRMTRLVQMLGLQRLDGDGQDVKRILPVAKDWIELEERRRTFWTAFYGDRWSSSGTGWPMIIDEKEIQTNLPASEESFESGVIEETVPLSLALTPEGASRISPFGGVILSACLFGHNFQHLHKTGPDEHPEDLANGEFWKRHRKMDNVLSNTFMFLPDHLRLPGGLRDMNVVFLHMNIHASTICLHQAAVLTAEKNNISKSFIRQSQARSLMAAEEIANTMKLVSHLDSSNMNSWMGFCLYIAGSVFIQDQKSEDGHPQSIENLEFLIAAMKAIGIRHSVTKHFLAQLELDIEGSGISIASKLSGKMGTGIPNTPMNGINPMRRGTPMRVSDLHAFGDSSTFTDVDSVLELCPYMTSVSKGRVRADSPPLMGVLPGRPSESPIVHRPPEGLHAHLHPSFPNWNPPPKSALHQSPKMNQDNQQHQVPVESHDFTSSNPPVPPDPNAVSSGSPFNMDSFLAGNTPSSDSSTSNTMQFPYRTSESRDKSISTDYSMFHGDPNSLIATADWTTETPFNNELQDGVHNLPGGIHTTDTARQFFDSEFWSQNPGPPG